MGSNNSRPIPPKGSLQGTGAIHTNTGVNGVTHDSHAPHLTLRWSFRPVLNILSVIRENVGFNDPDTSFFRGRLRYIRIFTLICIKSVGRAPRQIVLNWINALLTWPIVLRVQNRVVENIQKVVVRGLKVYSPYTRSPPFHHLSSATRFT